MIVNQIFFFFFVFIFSVSCSIGDRELFYQKCHVECQGKHCIQKNYREPPSFDLILFRWSCIDNCSYTCMHASRKKREIQNLPMVQYHGKWPFQRVFGIQEFASAFFSVLNIFPHLNFFLFAKSHRLPLHLKLVTFHSFMGALAFLFSVIFHSRDVSITEKLDYAGAFLYAVSLFAAMLSCAWSTTSTVPMKYLLYVNTFLFIFSILHLYYLFAIHFHYGWNLNVIITMTIFMAIFSFIYAYRLNFINQSWKVPLACILSLPLGLIFEVFDFEPLLLLLDAHACWHACTPPLFILFYSHFYKIMKKANKEA
jgi:post-GPI attachment to proteins factor 3